MVRIRQPSYLPNLSEINTFLKLLYRRLECGWHPPALINLAAHLARQCWTVPHLCNLLYRTHRHQALLQSALLSLICAVTN